MHQPSRIYQIFHPDKMCVCHAMRFLKKKAVQQNAFNLPTALISPWRQIPFWLSFSNLPLRTAQLNIRVRDFKVSRSTAWARAFLHCTHRQRRYWWHHKLFALISIGFIDEQQTTWQHPAKQQQWSLLSSRWSPWSCPEHFYKKEETDKSKYNLLLFTHQTRILTGL